MAWFSHFTSILSAVSSSLLVTITTQSCNLLGRGGLRLLAAGGMKREKSSSDRITTCSSGRVWNLERSKSACFAKVLVGG